MSDLEKILTGTSPRSIPPSWRREILAAAAKRPASTDLPWFWFLYPGHAYTGALAAVWLLILFFYADTPPAAYPVGPPVDMVRFAEAREERRILLVHLEEPELKIDVEKGEISMPASIGPKKGS